MWRPFNLLFLAYYVKSTNYRKLLANMHWVHQHKGKSYLGLAMDLLGSTQKYAASFDDYMVYRFFELDDAVRSSYANSGIMHRFYAQMNDRRYKKLFRSKALFYKHFGQLMGRQCLYLRECAPEAFAEWISTRPLVVVKPNCGMQGIGIEFVDTTIRRPEELYITLLQKGQDFVEEPIKQHESLQKLNPSCVNTLRVITVCTRNQIDIIGSILKCGIGGSRVDNMDAGGISTPVDQTSGQVYRSATTCSVWSLRYESHPDTLQPLLGFKVPFWGSVMDLARTAASIVPQVRTVGWDIAITSQGAVLVEGNSGWGAGLWQIPEGGGRLDVLRRYADL